MRFDLCQVLFVYGISDIGHRQKRHIYIGHDTIQRTGNRTMDVRCQVAIDGYLAILLQLHRSKTVRVKGDIQPHAIEVQTAIQRQIRAVHTIDRQAVEVHMIMLHHNRRLAKTHLHVVRFVGCRHTDR